VASLAAVALAISTVVLLIACANVGGLLLGRAGVRGREIGIRLALGAGRRRLVRQLLTESLLLAVVAGLAGLLLATWTTSALVHAAGVPFPLDVRPTPAVLGGTVLVTLLASLLFGTMPALHASRPRIAGTLESVGAGTNRRRSRMQHLFAVAQVALSLALLATAGLLVRSVQAASAEARADTFPEHVLTASFDLASQGYATERQWDFAQELLRRVRALPGVQAASLGSQVPGRGTRYTTVFVPGSTEAGGRPPLVRMDSVWPGYVRTMGMTLLAGRDLSDADGPGTGRVALANEAFIARYWPGERGIGRQFHFGDPTGAVVTIVGVVKERQRAGDTANDPSLYLARPQQAASRIPMAILVRASGPAEALAPSLRQVMSQLDPSVPLYDVATLRQVFDLHLLPRKAASSALDIFGGLALFLAAVGVYGLSAWTVSRRQREIGIRMALGASRGCVLRMVMRDAARIAAQGCIVGLLLAAAATRLIAGMVTGAVLADGVMYVAVTAIVSGMVFLASYVPARRATRVDPAVVLRVE
jgi:predicted permease